MFQTSHRFALYIGLAAGAACGQSSQFSGVLAGSVFDPPAGSIRMVLGYPGAARVGSSVYTGLDDAAIAPDGRNAVALTGNRIAGLRQVNGGPVQVVEFGTSTSRLDSTWSIESQTAVVWFPNADQTTSFQFWTVQNQPSAPVQSPLSYPALRCVRLLPGGRELLAAVIDGENSGIYRVGSDGATARIYALDDPSAIALDSVPGWFYFLDRKAGSIMRQPVDGSISPQVVVTQAISPAAAPGALAVLQDRRIALADLASSVVLIYGLDTDTLINKIESDGLIDGFLPLGGSDWLVLSHRRRPADSLLLLDPRAASVYFVPADGK